jgi:hypothetical protein
MAKENTTPEELTEEEKTALDVFINHQRSAAKEAGKALEGMIPSALREHGGAAFKEMVEGYRQLFNSVLDQVVDRIEKTRIKEGEEKDTSTE